MVSVPTFPAFLPTISLPSSPCTSASLSSFAPPLHSFVTRVPRNNKRCIITAVSSPPPSSPDTPPSNLSSAQELLRALSEPVQYRRSPFDDDDDDGIINEDGDREIGLKIYRSQGIIDFVFKYVKIGLNEDVNNFFDTPVKILPVAAASLLFGFFAATSATTIIGSVADWDPLAAAVLLILTESFTKYYYSEPRSSRLLQLANAFRIGLVYGMVVDSFKLCT